MAQTAVRKDWLSCGNSNLFWKSFEDLTIGADVRSRDFKIYLDFLNVQRYTTLLAWKNKQFMEPKEST